MQVTGNCHFALLLSLSYLILCTNSHAEAWLQRPLHVISVTSLTIVIRADLFPKSANLRTQERIQVFLFNTRIDKETIETTYNP